MVEKFTEKNRTAVKKQPSSSRQNTVKQPYKRKVVSNAERPRRSYFYLDIDNDTQYNLKMNYIYRLKINKDGSIDFPEELKQFSGFTFDMVLHPVAGLGAKKDIESIARNIPRPPFDESELEMIIEAARNSKD